MPRFSAKYHTDFADFAGGFGLLSGGVSDVVLTDVMTNSLRTGLFTTLREMGASIEESHQRGEAPQSFSVAP